MLQKKKVKLRYSSLWKEADKWVLQKAIFKERALKVSYFIFLSKNQKQHVTKTQQKFCTNLNFRNAAETDESGVVYC